jgi:hypothetical protein
MGIRVYCEHGALSGQIKEFRRSGRIELVHFPYDPDSRSRCVSSIAIPSEAQIRDLHLPIKDLPGAITDYSGSCHFGEIRSILGHQHRRDALHVDSAFKSGCSAFITQDSDILKCKTQLQAILGIRFFHAYADATDLEQLIVGRPPTTLHVFGRAFVNSLCRVRIWFLYGLCALRKLRVGGVTGTGRFRR